VQPLLLSMQTDADAKVREEAAETLGDYLDQPGVQQALRTASGSDADPAVRRQALSSLGSRRRG
jgi:HEAT repeat protein